MGKDKAFRPRLRPARWQAASDPSGLNQTLCPHEAVSGGVGDGLAIGRPLGNWRTARGGRRAVF